MDAVVKDEEMIEPKKEIEDTVELKEPKVELIDEMDVKKEEIDDDEYQHMIPYEYRDYMEQHDIKPKPLDRRRRPVLECQICGKTIVSKSFSFVENHAVTHTSLTKYSCPIEECNYKSWSHCHVTRHMKLIHKCVDPTAKDVVQRELSHEENAELLRKIGECFPGVTKPVKTSHGDVHNCQFCQKSITATRSNSTFCRRSHAIKTHTDLMFYKCIKPECDYETKYYEAIRQHQESRHGVITKGISLAKVELTIEQKLERERMVIQCFPELKDDSEYRIGLIEKMKIMVDTCIPESVIDENGGIQLKQERMDTVYKEVYEYKDCVVQKQPVNARKIPVEQESSRTFPAYERRVYSCQLCQSSITEYIGTSSRRRHAIMHTNIMLYKCINQDCEYKSKYHASISRHQESRHGVITKRTSLAKIELTIEQKLERERMVIQCFPELKEYSEYRIKLIEKDEQIDREKEVTSIAKTKEEELEEKPTQIMDYEEDIQLSDRKRKADQGTFETKKKKRV